MSEGNTTEKQNRKESTALLFFGSQQSSLPMPLFRLYEELRQGAENGASSPVRFNPETVTYEEHGNILTPHDIVLELTRGKAEDGSGTLSVSAAKTKEGLPENRIVIPMDRSLKKRLYDPIRRFLQENSEKYSEPAFVPQPEGMLPIPEPSGILAVIDTEMLFVHPTQFAGILIRQDAEGFHELSRFSSYVKLPPHKKLTKYVKQVTGQTDELLEKEGMEIHRAAEEIAAFLAPASLICGQQPMADIDMLRGFLLRESVALPPCLASHRVIDIQLMVRLLYDLPSNMGLEREAELVGIDAGQARFHDARSDTLVTAQIYEKLLPRFLETYKRSPDIPEAMLHAPKDTILLDCLPGPHMQHRRHSGKKVNPAAAVPPSYTLQSCPRCHGKAKIMRIRTQGTPRAHYIAVCTSCGFSAGGRQGCRTRVKAAAAWNAAARSHKTKR